VQRETGPTVVSSKRPVPKREECIMAQTRLNLELDFFGDTANGAEPGELAREIGRDHACHGLRPPAELLLAQPALRSGWDAGRASFAARSRAPTPQVQQWLSLRLQAWQEGRHFELLNVTPHYLGQISSAPACPVTRARFDTSCSAGVVRVCEDAAYAAGNLVCLSRTAAEAKTGLGWDDALHKATALREPGHHDGLSTPAWGRLGVLMSFVTPLAHERAARIPLLVLPPNRLRLLNPVQGLQAYATLLLAHSGWSQRLPAFEALLPTEASRREFKRFFMRLLAQALALGQPDHAPSWRWALEDAWRDAQVQQLWTGFALQLGPACCERVLDAAAAGLGLAGQRLVVQSVEQATEGWSLATQGYRHRTNAIQPSQRQPAPLRVALRLG
jgi:hypothetical protein